MTLTRELRKTLGFQTRVEFAKELGFSTSSVRNWDRGAEISEDGKASILRLARRLGKEHDVEELFQRGAGTPGSSPSAVHIGPWGGFQEPAGTENPVVAELRRLRVSMETKFTDLLSAVAAIRDSLPCNGTGHPPPKSDPQPAAKAGANDRELHDATPDDLEEKP